MFAPTNIISFELSNSSVGKIINWSTEVELQAKMRKRIKHNLLVGQKGNDGKIGMYIVQNQDFHHALSELGHLKNEYTSRHKSPMFAKNWRCYGFIKVEAMLRSLIESKFT